MDANDVNGIQTVALLVQAFVICSFCWYIGQLQTRVSHIERDMRTQKRKNDQSRDEG